jgi:hypothetical protein
MSAIHFVLQGKGGVGKSFAAVLLAQYLLSKDRPLVCADTDPVNATFTQYKSLNVAHVDIAENGRVLQQKFDPLIDKIATTDADFIIDNGAATFMPLTTYMSDNDIFDLLAEHGKKVYIHNILTAGQAKSDTLNGFETLAGKVNGSAKIVLWENEYWGTLDYNGHPVTALKLYKENKNKVAGIVKIAQRTGDDYISTIKSMTEKHMTFNDVLESTDFTVVAKSRVRKVVTGVFEELDRVEW